MCHKKTNCNPAVIPDFKIKTLNRLKDNLSTYLFFLVITERKVMRKSRNKGKPVNLSYRLYKPMRGKI